MTKDEERIKNLGLLIDDIQECSPFSALGFYTIDRSTLTATIGTVITYFLILQQSTSPCKSPAEII